MVHDRGDRAGAQRGVIGGVVLALLPVLLLGAASCNLLTLDGLQAAGGGAPTGAGGGGGERPGSSTAASSSTGGGPGTTGATSTATATSTASTGSGGGGGTGGEGQGGQGGDGGGCPDVCAGVDAVFCDAFDGPDPLASWDPAHLFTDPPVYSVVEDPHVSCPRAARIQFFGATAGEEGGWAQLNRTIPGAPTSVTASARVRRETVNPDTEGMFEIAWDRADKGCFFQLRVGANPRRASFYADQFDDQGAGVPLGSDSANLVDPTVGRWMDVEVELQVGAGAMVRATIDGVTLESPLDADGLATCDEAFDTDTLQVRIGAPYNDEPTDLYYDDVVVTVD